ncbi:MAG: glycosyltransferase family 9 protein [Terrimicrobiaceae bacterium]|nr:glycosyltransferase family 9 protein [Terrimicrobiaceae bacterium]
MNVVRPWPGLRKILVVRTDNIGDLVCTIPLIQGLRKTYPDSEIAVLANSYNRAVLDGHPDVDQVFAYTKRSHHESTGRLVRGSLAKIVTLARLRFRRFDIAIAAATPASDRTLRTLRVTGARDQLASTDKMPGLHEVERVWHLGKSLGLDGPPPAARIYPRRGLLAEFDASIRRRLGPDRLPVAVHLSSRKPSQQWPTNHFVEFLHRTSKAHANLGFVLLWSPGESNDPAHPGDDRKAADVLREAAGLPVVTCPTPTLPETIGALAACRMFFGSDGGAMHLAAGLGLPIVCLFGASSASQWHPWKTNHRLLQSPERDVTKIPPETVSDAVSDLLGQALLR